METVPGGERIPIFGCTTMKLHSPTEFSRVCQSIQTQIHTSIRCVRIQNQFEVAQYSGLNISI